MTSLQVTMNINDHAWPELSDAPAGVIERIARLPHGTSGGLSTVAVVIRLPDGSAVIGQTTLLLLTGAVRAFNAADKGAQESN